MNWRILDIGRKSKPAIVNDEDRPRSSIFARQSRSVKDRREDASDRKKSSSSTQSITKDCRREIFADAIQIISLTNVRRWSLVLAGFFERQLNARDVRLRYCPGTLH